MIWLQILTNYDLVSPSYRENDENEFKSTRNEPDVIEVLSSESGSQSVGESQLELHELGITFIASSFFEESKFFGISIFLFH